jgi:hypothetical protein
MALKMAKGHAEMGSHGHEPGENPVKLQKDEFRVDRKGCRNGIDKPRAH